MGIGDRKIAVIVRYVFLDDDDRVTENALARSAPRGRRRPARWRGCEPIRQPRTVLGQKNQEMRTGNPADRSVRALPGTIVDIKPRPAAKLRFGVDPRRSAVSAIRQPEEPTIGVDRGN